MREIILCCLATALPAVAQEVCGAYLVRGTYVAMCDGFVTLAPGAPLVPAKLQAIARSTPDGVINGEGTMGVGGAIMKQEVTGQAAVNADCTGTVKYAVKLDGQPAPDLNIRFVVLESGKVMLGLSVDPGTVISCRLDRMRT